MHSLLRRLVVLSFLVSSISFAGASLPEQGKNVFTQKGCAGCHTLGKGDLSGPDLKGLFDRRDAHWVENWLRDPEAVFRQNDPVAKEMLAKYSLKMPNLGLTASEIEALIAYIAANGGGKPVRSSVSKVEEIEDPVGQQRSQPNAAQIQVAKTEPGLFQKLKNWVKGFFGDSAGPSVESSMSLEEIAQARGLTQQDLLAAAKTYTPSGKHDPLLMFASGGHAGGVLVIGVPSMRILKSIPVFTPDSWHGYGFGSDEYKDLMQESSRRAARPLSWGDVHHPALSETKGSYDGQFLFVNDKANARVAVIDLRDFATKQIVKNPLFVNDHGGTFVTPDTEYVIQTSQYNVPLPNRALSLDHFKDGYSGVTTFWRFDRKKGRIDPSASFAVQLPPYWQDIADFGKKTSDGFVFINSINTEQGIGGNLDGKPNFEISASKNDMDFLHVIDWRKAEVVAKRCTQGDVRVIEGMRVISLKAAVREGILHLIHEPKSPHGVDVSPDGNYIVVSGKLDPHTTIYNFSKIKKAMSERKFSGKDSYGIPILDYDSVLEAQVEVGLGPLHTQFDKNGFAYTSLFLDSAIAKWTLGEPYHSGKWAWKLVDTVPVNYNIGHLSCVQGDTVDPGENYCVALNKWAIDRFQKVGPLMPQNFQLIDTSGEKMKVIYDLPIPNAEPHYVQIVDASRLKPMDVYPIGTSPATMEKSAHFTPAGKEAIRREGNRVIVNMTVIRSHITPDRIEVKKGDRVTIHLTNIETARDATHGFAISDYNINMSMEPGEVDSVQFVASKAGVFPFYCTEFCSALHLEMAGYLIVK